MMVSTKRDSSCISGYHNPASKRPRTSSQLLDFQSQSSVPSASPSCSAHSSGTVYEIRGIVGERGGEYLIDWADDPVTGESFDADWQPKGNVNSAAVRTWETRRPSAVSGAHSSSRPHESQGSSIADDSGFLRPQGRLRPERSTGSSERRFIQHEDSPLHSGRTQRSHSLPLEASSVTDLIERVSQHNSLDRDLYSAYESSLSSGATQLVTQHTHSSLSGESSRALSLRALERSSSVIPDSQPLPGSSSYLPPTESSHRSIISSGDKGVLTCTGENTLSLDDEYIVIPASQDSGRLRRSTSAPLPTINQALSTQTQGSTPSLPRSISDPCCILVSPIASPESQHLEIPDSEEKQELSSSVNRLQALTDSRNHPTSAVRLQDQDIIAARAHSVSRQIEGVDRIPETQDDSQKRASQATTTDASVVEDDRQGSDTAAEPVELEIFGDTSPNKPRTTNQGPCVQVPCSTTVPSRFLQVNVASQTMPESPVRGREGLAELLMNEGTLRSNPEIEQAITDARSQRLHEMGTGHQMAESVTATQSPINRSLQRQQSFDSELMPDGRQAKLRHSSQDRVRSIGRNSAPQSPTNPKMERLRGQGFPEIHSNNNTRSPQQAPRSPPIRSPSASQPNRKHALISSGPSSPLAKSFPLVSGASPDTIDSRASPSPSIIPARPPYVMQREPSRLEAQPLELDTTFRQPPPRMPNPQSVPHTPMTPSKLSLHSKMLPSQDDSVLDIHNLSGREHVVPLSMHARIREQYVHTIHHHARKIRKLFEERPCRRVTVDSINLMLDDICKVTTHTDLQGSGDLTQANVDPASEAAFAESCSEKFGFLAHFIERSKYQKINLYIAAKEGVILNILETYMKAKGVDWVRFHENSPNIFARPREGLAVFLIPSDRHHNTSSLIWPEPDAILGFDETFSMDRIANFHRNTYPPPIIRLVVFASLEHIDLCIPRDLHIVDRLRRLTYCLLQTQKRVGVLEDQPSSKHAAEFIAPFVQAHSMKRPDRGWPLPLIQPIDEISIMVDSEPRLSDARSDMMEPEGPLRRWPEPEHSRAQQATPHLVQRSGKRAFDIEPEDNLETQVKKLKMGPFYRSETDAVLPSETRDTLAQRLESAGRKIESLQKDLDTKARLSNELMTSAELRQYEYETIRKDNSDLAFKSSQTEALNLSLEQRIQSLNNRQQSLLETKEDLRRGLTESQAYLTAHPDEHIAARAQTQAKLEETELELANLKKTYSNLGTTFEFTRQQYQDASTRAAELSREVETLTGELAELRRLADGNAVAIQRMQQEDTNKLLGEEVDALKAALKQRDAMIFRLESDNLELKRGRAGVQTRGSSQQPRSPRGGGGSRGVSPAPGFLGGGGGNAMVRGGSGLGSRLSARDG